LLVTMIAAFAIGGPQSRAADPSPAWAAPSVDGLPDSPSRPIQAAVQALAKAVKPPRAVTGHFPALA